jgi:hypothetical protein
VHCPEWIAAKLFSMVIALDAQAFKHLEQAMQAAAQAFRAMPPFSLFMQAT